MLFLSAFILGLASSFHCMGMCGPIAMALPLNRSSRLTQFGGLLSNNLGRITSYSILGLVFGSIGFSLNLYHFFQMASIVVGMIMIIIAWRRQLLKHVEFSSSFIQKWISSKMGTLLASKSSFKLFGIGMLNGFLPCGMIFLALSSALLAENAVESAAVMAIFGLGTFPGLILVGYFAHQLSISIRQQMKKAFPYIMTLVGVLVILRGANLGIPYLSPKIEENKRSEHVNGRDPKTFQVMCHTPEKSNQ